MRIACVFAVLLAGCGQGNNHPPAAQPPVAGSAAPTATAGSAADLSTPATPAISCDDLCTSYATCYEEHYKRDYHGGGDCVTACEAKTADDKRAYADRIKAADSKGCDSLFSN